MSRNLKKIPAVRGLPVATHTGRLNSNLRRITVEYLKGNLTRIPHAGSYVLVDLQLWRKLPKES